MVEEELSPHTLKDSEFKAVEEAALKAQDYMKHHLSGAFKKLTDDTYQVIHDYLMEMMEYDAKFNFADLVRIRVNDILAGLLSGGWNENTAKNGLVDMTSRNFAIMFTSHIKALSRIF